MLKIVLYVRVAPPLQRFSAHSSQSKISWSVRSCVFLYLNVEDSPNAWGKAVASVFS